MLVALVMILYDRIFAPYVRRLANRTVVVEKGKLNLLVRLWQVVTVELFNGVRCVYQGLSTGEMMATIVSRLKGGCSWDALVGRFSWWVLDGPPIMEGLVEPVLDRSVPSIEQLAFAASFIRNCVFRYKEDALQRVVEWGNMIRLKSMMQCDRASIMCLLVGFEEREDAAVSALLGKSVQHVHRYAGLLQALEYGFLLCAKYADAFQLFPADGKVDGAFAGNIRTIFEEMFAQQLLDTEDKRPFMIDDDVVARAIDLVSGQIQQMKVLMDDRNAPSCGSGLNRSIVVLPVESLQRTTDAATPSKKAGKKGKVKSRFVC